MSAAIIRAAEMLEREAAGLKNACRDANGRRVDPPHMSASFDHDEMLTVAAELRAMR